MTWSHGSRPSLAPLDSPPVRFTGILPECEGTPTGHRALRGSGIFISSPKRIQGLASLPAHPTYRGLRAHVLHLRAGDQSTWHGRGLACSYLDRLHQSE